ncbi:transglycosylase SLT domain-containing protein [Roseibium sp. SCPC15]|uniref:transglycosylase SLT domain-containing protein n=1 Tax=Roseibium sp. SCP15 TaxID=3141376 RepID=UPI003338E683
MKNVPVPTSLRVSIFSLVALFAIPAQAEVQNICEREMVAAAQKYGVPLGVLYAVGLTETGRRNSLYPYALNIEGKSVFPPSRQAAKRDVSKARKHGKKLIDIGCMQINHHYHGDQFRSVDHMLEPRANVQYAARFLKELRTRQGSWTMAVARYHAGPNNNPAQKRYVCTVIRNMIAAGFGKWTKNSKKFCSSGKA